MKKKSAKGNILPVSQLPCSNPKFNGAASVSLPPPPSSPPPAPPPSPSIEMGPLITEPMAMVNSSTTSIHQQHSSMSSPSSSNHDASTSRFSTSNHQVDGSISPSVANHHLVRSALPSSSTPPTPAAGASTSPPSGSPTSSSVFRLSAAGVLAMSVGMTVQFMTSPYEKVGESLVPTLFNFNPNLFHTFLILNLVSITSILVLILIWLLESQKMPRWMEAMEQFLFQLGLLPLVADCYIFVWVIFPRNLKFIPCLLGSVLVIVLLYLYIYIIYIRKATTAAAAHVKGNAKSQ